MFSDSDDEGSQVVNLTVNEHYAKAFNYRKEREELEKLKEKYGSDFEEEDLEESTDSESAESEDEDGEELTPMVDAAILRTLARIRKKDPAIYDSNKSVFGEEANNMETGAHLKETKKPKDKSKPVTIRQVALDEALNPSRSLSPEPSIPTHVEEQRALRKETIAAFHSAVPDDEDVDDILVLRERGKDEVQEAHEEYRSYLQRQVGEDLQDLISIKGDSDNEDGKSEAKDAVEAEAKKKKKKKSKKKEKSGDKDQEFLMNYILNRGWIDNSSNRVPTYKEVTGKKGKGKQADSEESGNDDSGQETDSSFDSLASHFESSYNHRFEEPGADTIQTFPRNLTSIVRRADSSRKEARERKKTRKEEELAKKKEEVRRLKALKMKEIKRKLEKIGKEGDLMKGQNNNADADGSDNEMEEALQILDLEGDWDPEKHDQQMAGLFAGEDGDQVHDDDDVQYDADGRPIWNDDIDLGGILMSDDDAIPAVSSSKKKAKKDKKKKKKKKGDARDEDGVDLDDMDVDKIAEVDDEEWDGTEEMRKRKWKEYMNELYELDFNDLVGDMPTRFKYSSIPSQNYSLDPVEILLADDEDLNEYMSIKKYAPYRHDRNSDRSKWDPRQQEKLRDFRQKMKNKEAPFGLTRGEGRGPAHAQGPEDNQPKKRRKGKKERMREKVADGGSDGGDDLEVDPVALAPPAAEEKKRKRKPSVVSQENQPKASSQADEGQTKKKRRRRRGKKASDEPVDESVS